MDGFRREKVRSHLSLDGFSDSDDCDGEQALVEQIEEKTTSPSDSVIKEEIIQLVRRLIVMLPERQRVTLVLNYYEQLSFAEVANIMNCSIGTVKRHIYRALKTLANKLPDRGLL
jgi:RNA polymerase sigma-70 factor (ECF subfamily)